MGTKTSTPPSTAQSLSCSRQFVPRALGSAGCRAGIALSVLRPGTRTAGRQLRNNRPSSSGLWQSSGPWNTAPDPAPLPAARPLHQRGARRREQSQRMEPGGRQLGLAG